MDQSAHIRSKVERGAASIGSFKTMDLELAALRITYGRAASVTELGCRAA